MYTDYTKTLKPYGPWTGKSFFNETARHILCNPIPGQSDSSAVRSLAMADNGTSIMMKYDYREYSCIVSHHCNKVMQIKS